MVWGSGSGSGCDRKVAASVSAAYNLLPELYVCVMDPLLARWAVQYTAANA